MHDVSARRAVSKLVSVSFASIRMETETGAPTRFERRSIAASIRTSRSRTIISTGTFSVTFLDIVSTLQPHRSSNYIRGAFEEPPPSNQIYKRCNAWAHSKSSDNTADSRNMLALYDAGKDSHDPLTSR